MKNITISCFPNAKALPLWIARDKGFFASRNLVAHLHETESSKIQREKLMSGDVQIVQSAVDNALSLIADGHDVFIFMGGENGMNDFMVQPEITGLTDLRGRNIVVDSPHTAYALLVRKMLKREGLVYEQDYRFNPVGNASHRLAAMLASKDAAGGVLNPPYTAQAKQAGLKSLGRLVDYLGPYQAGGGFARRSWAQAHPDALEGFIAAYVEALRWIAKPAHAEEIEAMLASRLELSPEIAKATRADLLEPGFGFTPDAKLDMQGMESVLETRAETEGEDPHLTDRAAYIDESYYKRALATFGDA